jgi:hypothetical protein
MGICQHHVDTRNHFIRESIEEGTVKIKFFKSCDNNSDIFRKNVNQEMYKQPVKKFLGKEDTGTWRFRDRIKNNPHAQVI